jgi:hypothetical protein
MRIPISIVLAASFACSFAVTVSVSGGAFAQGDQTRKKDSETAAAAPAGPPTNACGCYEDSAGQCICTKKSKCGCPGACEPAGCEEKRAKELEKEARAETKRQQDEERKRNAELEKKRSEMEKKEAEKQNKGLRGLRLVEPDPNQ